MVWVDKFRVYRLTKRQHAEVMVALKLLQSETFYFKTLIQFQDLKIGTNERQIELLRDQIGAIQHRLDKLSP